MEIEVYTDYVLLSEEGKNMVVPFVFFLNLEFYSLFQVFE